MTGAAFVCRALTRPDLRRNTIGSLFRVGLQQADLQRVCRVLLGAYVSWHFATLVPWSTELFSNAGVFPRGAASPLLHAFPNVLAWWDGPLVVTALAAAGMVSGVLLALGGAKGRVAAAVAWYVLACFLGRNPLILNPSMPYLGFLLLGHAVLSAEQRRSRSYYRVVLIIMAAGYSYSGITKLASPSWLDGSAVRFILENPLARPSALRTLLLGTPEPLLQLLTWGTLLLELAYLPLAIWRRARPLLWLAMVTLHLSLLVLMDFADLTLGMLVLHAFTFDPTWLQPGRAIAALPGSSSVAVEASRWRQGTHCNRDRS